MKSVVCLSAGLDSTLNFYEARLASEVVCAISFDYGQRAAVKEIEFAQKLSGKFKIPHKSVKLDFFHDLGKSSLVDRNLKVPTEDVEIDNMVASSASAKSVWVPNRNGIMLNVAAGFAESLGSDWIVPGFNAEEAKTFPDNSGEFIEALTGAFHYSTANHVKVKCFTTELNKTQIVKRGIELKVDFENIWPCYFGGSRPCGECESCKRFVRAVSANSIHTKWMQA